MDCPLHCFFLALGLLGLLLCSKCLLFSTSRIFRIKEVRCRDIAEQAPFHRNLLLGPLLLWQGVRIQRGYRDNSAFALSKVDGNDLNDDFKNCFTCFNCFFDSCFARFDTCFAGFATCFAGFATCLDTCFTCFDTCTPLSLMLPVDTPFATCFTDAPFANAPSGGGAVIKKVATRTAEFASRPVHKGLAQY